MNIKIATIICATLFLVGILIWPTIYRYDRVTINGNVLPIRMNRLTGFTEYYNPGKGWVSEQRRQKSKNIVSIPAEEKEKVKVTTNWYNINMLSNGTGFFDAKIYNGSSWTVTGIVFRFKMKGDKIIKLIGWSTVYPLSMGNVSIQSNEEGLLDWEIDEIRGYRD